LAIPIGALASAAGITSKTLALGLTAGTAALYAAEVLRNLSTPAPQNLYTAPQNFIFPGDLPQTSNNRSGMIFQFYQYNRPSVLTTPVLNPIGTITLPLPSQLQDHQQLNYEETNFAASPALGGALDAASGDGGTAGKAAAIAEALAVGVGANVTAGLADGLTAQLNAKAKALQLGGLAQNPFLTVLFNSPSFKRHSFSWSFIPENAKDAATLNFILNKFRYHSLPDISDGTSGLLLTYPDMVKPFIVPSGFMYDFKYCVIENMIIDYAPGATPNFQGSTMAPSAIKFTVNFLEIEYWIKSNIVAPSYMSGIYSTASAGNPSQ
jgi:hypothetical protein